MIITRDWISKPMTIQSVSFVVAENTKEKIEFEKGNENLVDEEMATHLYGGTDMLVNSPTEFVVEFPGNDEKDYACQGYDGRDGYEERLYSWHYEWDCKVRSRVLGHGS
jgi:hypothetical protein